MIDWFENVIISARLRYLEKHDPISVSYACYVYLDWPIAMQTHVNLFGDAVDHTIAAEVFQYLESNPAILPKVPEPDFEGDINND